MYTTQLLLQIINILHKKPEMVNQIPWIDLQKCVIGELERRDFLYPESQYQNLLCKLNSVFDTITYNISHEKIQNLILLLESLYDSLSFFPEFELLSSHYEDANFDHACLRHHRENTIIVLGDSHVNFFSGNEHLNLIPIGNDINTCPQKIPYLFTPLHLGPCLAFHCTQPNTKVLFYEKLQYLLQNFIRPQATIICCLGEIDLRVHVFRQTLAQNKSYQEIIDKILESYCSLLSYLQECGFQVYCWGPIATQPDSCPIDPNYPRTDTEINRNLATSYFNNCLSMHCRQHGIGFLSVFPKMVTDDFHTRSEFLSSDQCHLGQAALPLALPEWEKINHPILPSNLL